jgi:hypothetical protein
MGISDDAGAFEVKDLIVEADVGQAIKCSKSVLRVL